MVQQQQIPCGKRILTIVGASCITFLVIIVIASLLGYRITKDTNLAATNAGRKHSQSQPTATTRSNQQYQLQTPQPTRAGSVTLTQPTQVAPAPDTSSSTDNTTQPTRSTTPIYSQYYWYCWNSGDLSPHHLGYPVSNDHICSDQELHAAHWSGY